MLITVRHSCLEKLKFQKPLCREFMAEPVIVHDTSPQGCCVTHHQPESNQSFNHKDLTDEPGRTAMRLYFNLSISHSTIHKPNFSEAIYGTGKQKEEGV